MDEPITCVRVVWPTGARLIIAVEEFDIRYFHDHFEEWRYEEMIGEKWVFELIMMDREEYEALPEFTGP